VAGQGVRNRNPRLEESDRHAPYGHELCGHGRQTSASITGAPIVGPSSIPYPVRKEMPHPLSAEEIQGLVEAFRQAARRMEASASSRSLKGC
jgi:2,4-dienoyl-CoA reductase-like NADH-dependent reductase (Old Yellow Enzyme family)